MRIWNKKGIMEIMIGKIILALVGFFMVAAFIVGLFNNVKDPANDEACRDGLTLINFIAKQRFIANPGEIAQTAKPLPHACQYEKVELKKEKTEEVEREIVKLMERCWYRMGSGAFGPFARTKVVQTAGQCLICSVFQAKDLEQPILVDSLMNHLQKIYRPDGKSYAEYLNILETPIEDNSNTNEITNGKYYAVLFYDYAPSQATQIVTDIAGAKELENTRSIYLKELNDAKECYDANWFLPTEEVTVA